MTTSESRQRAFAKVAVQRSEARPFDSTERPELVELHLFEVFTGDLQGDSAVRALQVSRDDKSATLISLQRFRGTLAGRKGTFILQGQETIADGKIHASWFVVPKSGTDELSDLRGEGGFEGVFGQGSNATLEYWFEH
jgi:hypothetical protein